MIDRMRLAAAWIVVPLSACGFTGTGATGDGRGDSPPASDGAVTDDGAATDPSLVAWYPFDAIADGAEDATGNGHAGTCASCPVASDGAVAGAARFDGVENRIDVAHAADLSTTDGFTVTTWVRFAKLPDAGHSCPVNKGLAGGIYNSWQLCYAASSQGWFFGSQGATWNALVRTPGPQIDAWHHVALRWDGGQKTLWVDGARLGAFAQTGIVFDGDPITFGADLDASIHTNTFAGALDDVRIYNRPLADDEIARLAAP